MKNKKGMSAERASRVEAGTKEENEERRLQALESLAASSLRSSVALEDIRDNLTICQINLEGMVTAAQGSRHSLDTLARNYTLVVRICNSLLVRS